MKQMNGPIKKALAMSAMIFLLLVIGSVSSYAEEADVSKVVFYVSWYDVGKAALEGLQGVIKVEKGFHGLKEINTVFYDPAIITINEMKKVLKDAGTYQGTVK